MFFVVIGLFLAAQVLKLVLLAPMPEYGGDAARKWFLAKDLAGGSLEVFRATDYVSHHYLRWGTWMLPAVFIWVFGDSVVLYYLSTFLPATLAAVIFLSLFYRHFGLMVTAFLAMVWVFDPQLNRALFQLLPTGAGLLPLALIVIGFQRFVDGKLAEQGLALWLSLCLFWLYGAKETNVFFFPGVFAAIWVLAGRRTAFVFTAICVVLYVTEAVVLSAMQGEVMIGGRLLELLLGDSQHLELMFNSAPHIEQQEELWDAGILSRWYTVMELHLPVYIPSIMAFISVVVAGLKRPAGDVTGRLAVAISLSALSFVLLTSFFIVSLDPVRLGQPLRPRYIVILLPLCAFVLVYVIRQLAMGRVFGHAGRLGLVTALVLALGYFAYDRTYRKNFLWLGYTSLKFDLRPKDTLAGWIDHFETLGKQLPPDYCELEKQDFKRLYYGLMYVPQDSHAPEQLKVLGECARAARHE